MEPPNFFSSKVWVISEVKGATVLFTSFSDVLNNVAQPRKIELADLLKRGPFYDDRKVEVTFNLGDLATIQKVGSSAFHIANVGPSNTTTQLQYEYVLGRLGLGPKIAFQDAMKAADGQFRRLFTSPEAQEN